MHKKGCESSFVLTSVVFEVFTFSSEMCKFLPPLNTPAAENTLHLQCPNIL